MSDTEVDRLFQALADATRRDIVVRAMAEDHSISALASRYDMSFAAVQKHVAVLERASLVTKVRHGRQQIVHGNVETLRKAARLLDDYERLWFARIDRIGDLLAGPEKGKTR